MVFLLFSFFYYYFLRVLVDKHAKNELLKLSKTSEAIDLRNRIKSIRTIGITLIISSYILWVVIIGCLISNDMVNLLARIFQGILSLSICHLSHDSIMADVFGTITGNISIYSKKAWMQKHSSFNLYLRAFEQDNYTMKKKVVNGEDFSEYHFIKEFEKYYNFCAVGMAKELDTPFGASRVYVDDNSWKTDVLELMEAANYIVILVSDRPSCLWEIEKSFIHSHKTTYIFHDICKYESMKTLFERNQIGVHFPEMPNDCIHFCARMIKGEMTFMPYINTIEDYQNIITFSAGRMFDRNKKNVDYIKDVIRRILLFMLTLLLAFLSSIL